MTSAYADRAISGELAELAAAPAGRNNTLFRAAARCYQFAVAGVRDEGGLTDELTAAGLATGLSPAEVRDTLRSARRRAAQMDDAARMELAARCAGQHSAAHPPAPAVRAAAGLPQLQLRLYREVSDEPTPMPVFHPD